jgi:hypothetical protein
VRVGGEGGRGREGGGGEGGEGGGKRRGRRGREKGKERGETRRRKGEREVEGKREGWRMRLVTEHTSQLTVEKAQTAIRAGPGGPTCMLLPSFLTRSTSPSCAGYKPIALVDRPSVC